MNIGVPDFFRVDPQLQSGTPTEGEDCAFQCARGMIRWGTNGAVEPTIKALRNLAGVPTGGTGPIVVRDLCRAYGVAARFTTDYADAEAALNAGDALMLCVNYRWINDNQPQLSGDRDFDGLHAVGVYGWETPISAHWVAELDPLHDGRRKYPKQIVMSRWAWLREAARAMPSGFQAVVASKGG